MALELEIVSPEKILYSGEARFVRCRTIGGGELAFLTGHAPFIGALDICDVKVETTDGEELHVAVHGGFVEVSNDHVTVLSDVAELANQIDTARAERAREKAENDLRTDADSDEALAALKRADIRIQVAQETPAPTRH
jgi:F-type H+-transporting ATPase subunit epsilon